MRPLITVLLTLNFVAAPSFAQTPEPSKPANPVKPAATGLITVATVDTAEATKPALARLGCASGICLTAAPIDALAKGEAPIRLFAGKVEGGWAPYVVKDETRLKVRSVSIVKTPAGTEVVRVALDPASAKIFTALTTRIIGERLAIIVDGRVVTAPKVMETITGDTLQIEVGAGGDAAAMVKAIEGK